MSSIVLNWKEYTHTGMDRFIMRFYRVYFLAVMLLISPEIESPSTYQFHFSEIHREYPLLNMLETELVKVETSETIPVIDDKIKTVCESLGLHSPKIQQMYAETVNFINKSMNIYSSIKTDDSVPEQEKEYYDMSLQFDDTQDGVLTVMNTMIKARLAGLHKTKITQFMMCQQFIDKLILNKNKKVIAGAMSINYTTCQQKCKWFTERFIRDISLYHNKKDLVLNYVDIINEVAITPEINTYTEIGVYQSADREVCEFIISDIEPQSGGKRSKRSIDPLHDKFGTDAHGLHLLKQ